MMNWGNLKAPSTIGIRRDDFLGTKQDDEIPVALPVESDSLINTGLASRIRGFSKFSASATSQRFRYSEVSDCCRDSISIRDGNGTSVMRVVSDGTCEPSISFFDHSGAVIFKGSYPSVGCNCSKQGTLELQPTQVEDSSAKLNVFFSNDGCCNESIILAGEDVFVKTSVKQGCGDRQIVRDANGLTVASFGSIWCSDIFIDVNPGVDPLPVLLLIASMNYIEKSSE